MWYRCSHHKPNRSWGTFQKVLCNWFPLKAGRNWLRGWKYKDEKRLGARGVRWILNYEIKFGLFCAFICFVYEHSGFSKEEDVQNPSFFFLFCHFYHFYYDLHWFVLIARQRFRGFLHSSEFAKCRHLVVIMYAFCVVQLHPDRGAW